MKSLWRKSTLVRFFFCFILVLILPVMVFSIIYMQYYQKLYRGKLEKQAESELDLVMQDLIRYADECCNISIQNSLSADWMVSSLQKDYCAKNVTETLQREVSTHEAIDGIAYYTKSIPDVIYSNAGTYALTYYRQYPLDGRLEDLADFLPSLSNNTWVRSYDRLEDGRIALQYIVRLSGGNSYFLYTLSEQVLARMLEKEGTVTFLYAQDGEMLYPFQYQEMGYDTVKRSEIVYDFEERGLRLVRFEDDERLYGEANRLRNLFLLCVGLVMLGGGVIVAFLSFYSNKPIKSLQDFCEEIYPDMPSYMDGMGKIRFALNRMDERIKHVEDAWKRERILLQLVYGKDSDSDYFRERLLEEKIFTQTEVYYVFLAMSDREDGGESYRMAFEVGLNGKYECHIMEYARSGAILGILGMAAGMEAGLRHDLEDVAGKIRAAVGGGVCIFVGDRCTLKSEIHRSYLQALSMAQEDGGRGSSVIWYQDRVRKKIDFTYPTLELGSLYDALLDANIEKVGVLTDVLIDAIQGISENRFLCTTLCYAVLSTYYRAKGQLETGQKPEIDIEDVEILYRTEDTEENIRLIQKLREQFCEYLEREARENRSEKQENIATRVFAFIECNIEDRDLSVSMVADHFHMSISNISHQFKALTNQNISDYIVAKKFGYASELLMKTEYSIQQIAEMLGYNRSNSFARKFKQYYGMTPMEYRTYNSEDNAAGDESMT